MRYLAVAAAMVASLCVYAFFAGLAEPQETPRNSKPLGIPHQNCGWVATLAENQRMCPNGIIYSIQNGEWVDSGPPRGRRPTPAKN